MDDQIPDRAIAFSESRCQDDNTCVYPDNWLITPPVTLPENAETIVLHTSVAAGNIAKSQERFFAYVTNTIAGAIPDWSDFIEELPPPRSVAGWDSEQLLPGVEKVQEHIFDASDDSWHIIDGYLDLFQGETVYIAFRHAYSADQDILKLADINITWAPAVHTVTGSVKLSGEPLIAIEGATVSLLNTEPELPSPELAFTESDGSFSVDTFPGTFTIRVYGTTPAGRGFDTTLPNAIPVYDDVSGINIVISAVHSISGKVMYGLDTPIPIENASVVLINTNGSETPQPVQTASNGTYRIDTFAGTYTVRAYGTFAGHPFDVTLLEPIPVNADVENVDFEIIPTWTVSGTVMYATTTPAPIENARVELIDSEDAVTAFDLTASDGTYSINTPGGTYTVRVFGAVGMHQFDETRSEPLSINSDAPNVNFSIIPMYQLSGTVVFGVNNTQMPGAVITFTHVGEGGVSPEPVTSGAMGAFTVFARAGSYNWSVVLMYEGEEYSLSSETPVVVPQIVPLWIHLGSAGDGDLVNVPTVTTLRMNYPNPFNPSTTISFDVAQAGHVVIEVFNVRGQRVQSLVDGVYVAGRHSVVWDGNDFSGRNVASGMYFYRMTTGNYSSVRKMLLMK